MTNTQDKPKTIRRFYQLAHVEPVEGGFALLLDGKQAHTPQRHRLLLPTHALAETVAEEFNAQADTINPAAMPMTQMAYILLDLVTAQRGALVDELCGYIDTDLLYYRSDDRFLAAQQAELWDMVLSWAMDRYDISFHITNGVMPITQDAQTVKRLTNALSGLSSVQLAAATVTVRATGSVLLTLALLEKQVPPAQMAVLSRLEEDFQTERWGDDDEKQTRLARLEQEIHEAARFISLVDTTA